MGSLLSRFYEKPSTRVTLEKIEQELQNIEERRWDKIKKEQFIVQILSFIPITILIANICILIYPSESTLQEKLVYSVPIVILNLVLWVSKKIVQWYSRWSLDNEEVRLRKLQKEKKRILDLVCETESYRVATELLEKYDPKQLRRRERQSERPTSPLNSTLSKISQSPVRSPQQQHKQQSQLQPSGHSQDSMLFHSQSVNLSTPQRIGFQLPAPPPPPPPTPASKSANKPQMNTTLPSINSLNASVTAIAASSVQGRPVRPVLSKDRSFFEKVVDWVVADGPNNRFALVCRYCYGHNGMSLAEEYETINFRCCYCYNLNTATNKRQIHDQLQPERERAESLGSLKSDEVVGAVGKEVDSQEKEPSSEPENKKDKQKSKSMGATTESHNDDTSTPVEEQKELATISDKKGHSDEALEQSNGTEATSAG